MSNVEERDFDVVVFGASGVTGQYVVEELARFASGVKWAVAGRDPEKLRATLGEIGEMAEQNLDKIGIIQADVHIRDSLTNMCKQTKLVLNCVGPYRFFGEKVVEECIKSGTHHVDVSGEPQFLETMQVKYFDQAKEKHVYIVGSCGFDSIPSDVGVEVLKDKFDGDMRSVETYMEFKSVPGTTVNFATWQSAIYGLAHASELKSLRKMLKEKLFTKKIPKGSFRVVKRPLLFKSEEVNNWCIPFIGSDKSVVLRTQMYNYQFKNQRPVEIQTFMCVSSLLHALVTMFMGLIFGLMTRFSFGQRLLEKYPEKFSLGLFSKKPPAREKNLRNSFSITFKADGWFERLSDPTDVHTQSPNKSLKMILNGPDPAYVSTAICVVNAALVILAESDKMPDTGGVLTPGAAFHQTTLVQRLEKRGITYTVIKP